MQYSLFVFSGAFASVAWLVTIKFISNFEFLKDVLNALTWGTAYIAAGSCRCFAVRQARLGAIGPSDFDSASKGKAHIQFLSPESAEARPSILCSTSSRMVFSDDKFFFIPFDSGQSARVNM
jgi:hypothetical protein